MKKWAWSFLFPVLICCAVAQVSSSNPQEENSSYGTWKEAKADERMFFPRDMFWGWAQFDLAPPHNEVGRELVHHPTRGGDRRCGHQRFLKSCRRRTDRMADSVF